MNTLMTVPVGSYQVTIGGDLTEQVVAAVADAPKVALLHAPALAARAAALGAALGAQRVQMMELPDAEDAKSLAVLGQCWDDFGRFGLDRTGAVIGLGGGSVTDVAGFAAASWLRGVKLVQVPSSILGMVDAAVGGKTGINTAAGKNMVGAFYEPAAVLVDLSLLQTLPQPEMAGGLAEVIKCGFIADPVILEILAAYGMSVCDPSSPQLAELIQRAVAVKAAVVTADLREAGPREILNYGHTLGHAIEKREGYRWRHGQAISVGMVFAAALGRAAGYPDMVAQHREILGSFGLPVHYDASALDALVEYMAADKKSRAGQLRFVVLREIADPTRLVDPSAELIRAAYAAVAKGM